MKNKRTFMYLISAVILSGILFSVFVFFKIKSIRSLRTATDLINKEITSQTGRNYTDDAISKKIPARIWAVEFIEKAYFIADKTGIKDLMFEQKSREALQLNRHTQNTSGKITSYPAKMTFHSGYREMAEFIHKLQSLDRLVTIQDLKIKPYKSTLAVEATVVTYSMEAQ